MGQGVGRNLVPVQVPPGGVAIGLVFFTDPPPADSAFEFTVADGGYGAGSIFDLRATMEANVAGDSIVGTVTNNDSGGQFVTATVICFDADGRPTISTSEFTSPPDLPAGATGSFQADLFGSSCDTFLIGVTSQRE